jgi:hypothetical protein
MFKLHSTAGTGNLAAGDVVVHVRVTDADYDVAVLVEVSYLLNRIRRLFARLPFDRQGKRSYTQNLNFILCNEVILRQHIFCPDKGKNEW